MLTRLELLKPLSQRRTDEVVITTMGTVRPWGALSDHPLDFASADSAMGHAADLALGVALAQPKRRVICFNGDGSMLMSLGTLVTIVDSGATNLMLVVAQNETYEITGNQAIPGAGRVDFAAMATAAGFPSSFHVRDPQDYLTRLPSILAAPGPVFLSAAIQAENEGPISRGMHEPARYLQSSLADWSWQMRGHLTGESATSGDPGPLE